MENLSDIQLVKNIQCDRKTEDSLQELINRHSGIYLDIVHSYMKHCPFPDLRQDIINDKAIIAMNDFLIFNSLFLYHIRVHLNLLRVQFFLFFLVFFCR